MNAFRGQIPIELAGTRRTLRFTWGAVADLQRVLGTDFDARISEAMASLDLQTLSAVIAIGLRHEWPEATADKIFAASPPIVMATKAIQDAMQCAFQGPGEVTAQPPANPLLAALSRAKLTLSGMFWFPRSQRA